MQQEGGFALGDYIFTNTYYITVNETIKPTP